MYDSNSNTGNSFRKSDKYLILFLLIALLLVNAILNFIFGQSYKRYAQFNINNISTYVWNNGEITEGEHQLEFDGRSLSSGIYFYTLTVDNKIIDKRKMMLLK